MLFQPEHIELIKQGEKTATRRDWKQKMAKVGGVYPCQTELFQPKEECEVFIWVTDMYKQKLHKMSAKDFEKEGYRNKAAFVKVWEQIYGIGSWTKMLEKKVWVIEFETVNPDE